MDYNNFKNNNFNFQQAPNYHLNKNYQNIKKINHI